jgi:hypothetical protein
LIKRSTNAGSVLVRSARWDQDLSKEQISGDAGGAPKCMGQNLQMMGTDDREYAAELQRVDLFFPNRKPFYLENLP